MTDTKLYEHKSSISIVKLPRVKLRKLQITLNPDLNEILCTLAAQGAAKLPEIKFEIRKN